MIRARTLEVTRICAADPAFQAALATELQVFGIANGFASSADLAAGRMVPYRRYDASSEFYIARDARGELAGIARLIRHDVRLGIDSFSTIVDAGSYSAHGEPARTYLDPGWAETLRKVPPRCIAELATQSIAPSYRRFRAIDALWRAMVDASRADGVELWTMALVVPLFQFYKAMFPEAIHAIGSVMPDYIGADSVPAALRLTHPAVEAYFSSSDDGRRSEVSNGCNVSEEVHRSSTAV